MLAYLPLTFSSPMMLKWAVGDRVDCRDSCDAPSRAAAFDLLSDWDWVDAAGAGQWGDHGVCPAVQEVVVMVDLSASTRTAEFRHRDWLEKRIAQLLGATLHRVVYFAGENRENVAGGNVLADIPSEHTAYAPPGAAAVVLFSDCQFDLPHRCRRLTLLAMRSSMLPPTRLFPAWNCVANRSPRRS